MKRKKSSSTEKDRPVSAKVQKLGASPTDREPERASSPLAEAPMVLSPPPPSKPGVEAKSLLGAAVEQPLAVMPITVWNPPLENAKSPPRSAAELKRRNRNQKLAKTRTLCSLTPNSRQVRSHPSSRPREVESVAC